MTSNSDTPSVAGIALRDLDRLRGIASVAAAHHSFSMFIMEKEVTIKGTVREFQWTNPHTWTKVDVEGGGSAVVEYGLEGMSPNYLSRNGWSKRSLKPGDPITMVVHPMRDGSPGGSIVKVMTADGKVVGDSP